MPTWTIAVYSSTDRPPVLDRLGGLRLRLLLRAQSPCGKLPKWAGRVRRTGRAMGLARVSAEISRVF